MISDDTGWTTVEDKNGRNKAGRRANMHKQRHELR
jgi:hypothetical protein